MSFWLESELRKIERTLKDQHKGNADLFEKMKACVLDLKSRNKTEGLGEIVEGEISKMMKVCENVVKSDAEMVLYNQIVKSVAEEYKVLDGQNNGDDVTVFSFNEEIEARYKELKKNEFNITDSKLNVEFVKLQGGDLDDDDMEVMDDGEATNLTCPLSLQEFVKPVQISSCKHVFSKSSLDAVMGRGNGRFQCPMAGCQNTFLKSDLIPDKDTEVRLKIAKRRRDALARSQANFDD